MNKPMFGAGACIVKGSFTSSTSRASPTIALGGWTVWFVASVSQLMYPFVAKTAPTPCPMRPQCDSSTEPNIPSTASFDWFAL